MFGSGWGLQQEQGSRYSCKWPCKGAMPGTAGSAVAGEELMCPVLVGELGRVLTSVFAAWLISHLILSCQRGLEQDPQLEHREPCPDTGDKWDAASTALSHKENRITWQSRNQLKFRWVIGCNLRDKSIVSTPQFLSCTKLH